MDDAFDFTPLSDAERLAAEADGEQANAGAEEGEIVSPVPANAPPAPSNHPRLGCSTKAWDYRDAKGALLSRVMRFDQYGERKQFLPLTLWRGANSLAWRWKAAPAPRPLYGLDRLAGSPAARVIVCEGEKSADAAARIFPNHVAVRVAGPAGVDHIGPKVRGR